MLTNPNGQVLQRPLRDGTTRCLFEPLDFLSGVAAFVPRPCAHRTHYHGAAKLPPHPSFGVTTLRTADGHSPFVIGFKSGVRPPWTPYNHLFNGLCTVRGRVFPRTHALTPENLRSGRAFRFLYTCRPLRPCAVSASAVRAPTSEHSTEGFCR